MSNNEITAHDMNELLPSIVRFLEHYEINVSKMCKETGIPRSTLYDFLFKDSNILGNIQRIIDYLGVEVSIKPARK